jgi:DNA invertase Pin-like site-specific DNA recombinase
MSKYKLGYARVSTLDQDPALQHDALTGAGCARIFVDKASGKLESRPALDNLLEQARPGDTVVVWRLDRLGRSLKHLLETVSGLEQRGVAFVSLTEQIDTSTPGGRLIFHVFGALAEFEAALIRERTQAGLAAARARGRTGGRPTVWTPEKLRTARASDNETVSGWTGNHETFHVYWSWNETVWPLYGADVTRRLEQHWDGTPDAGWAVLPVPAALRDRLVHIVPAGWQPPAHDPDPRLRDLDLPDDPLGGGTAPGWVPEAPPEDPDARDRAVEADRTRLLEVLNAPRSRTMVGVASAGAVPLPHKQLVAVRAVETFPRGYLLADEVGLGKTIEAGLILRELLLSGRIETALLLVPASVLSQWQEELHEKISLDVPRYEGGVFLDRHNREVPHEPTENPWTAFPVVLASSHLARRADRRAQVLAGRWDVVLVDEAHHARRRGLKPNGTPNTLLDLLQSMRAQRSWQALYLASATPMQMAPHEAWDLIELLDLPGEWAESADKFVRYFAELRRPHEDRDWALLSRMLRDEVDAPDAVTDEALRIRVVNELGPVLSRSVLRLHEPPAPTRHRVMGWKASQGRLADDWLRAHTPMRDRVFRHTRGTMRRYQEQGLLPADLVIPRRTIRDEFIELSDAERTLYERIDAYISRYYNAYMTAGPGDPAARALGFIMTVYRRRLTGSFQAVRLSLKRRRDALAAGRALAVSDLLDQDDRNATEDDDSQVDLSAVANPIASHLLSEEIAALDSFIADIEALGGQDTKAEQLRRPPTGRRRRLRQCRAVHAVHRHDGLPPRPPRRALPARRVLLRTRRRAMGPCLRDLAEDHKEQAQAALP